MNTGKPKCKISIKTKLLGIIIPIVTVIVAALITISYIQSKNIISDSANNLLETSSKNQVNQIESWLNENLSSFKAVKTSLENTELNGTKLQKLLDKYYGYDSNYPEGFYIADKNGKMIKAQKSKKSNKNILNSVWYNEGLTRINMAFGSPYKNDDGKKIISASGILNDKSGVTKVLSVDLNLDRISIIVNSMIEMNNASAFLVDNRNKTILAHENSSLISTKLNTNNHNKFLKDVAAKLNTENYNSCELDNNMVTFKEVAGTDWILVSYVPTKSILSGLLQLRNFMIIIAFISIIILIILIERVIHLVIKPIKKLTDTIISLTNGDFTVDVEVKGNDEISIMLNSVKEFIVVMRKMINDIGLASKRLNVQADGSNTISKELYDSSILQFESMKELNHTVDQLSSSVNEIAESASTLASVVNDTRNESLRVDQNMQETVNISEKGKQDMEKVNIAMENIQNSVCSLEEAIYKVGKSSTEINNIVSIIDSIAKETRLLSLNASIEAARAGEAGKGFAVVAAQIGKLAQESSESVKNISSLVNEINSHVSDTVTQASDSSKNIHESSQLISNTVNTFDTIFEKVSTTNNLIQEMNKKINNLEDVATTVASISEEQAASSQEILATSDVMVTQSNNITKNSENVATDAQNLSTTSEEIDKHIQIFKI